MFSPRFDEEDEDHQVLDAKESYIIFNITQKLLQSVIYNVDIRSHFEQQYENQKGMESGWRFDKTNLLTIHSYKIAELNKSSSVKVSLRFSALSNKDKYDKNCFLWSVLVHFYPCESNLPNRVSKYKQYLTELDNDGFDFSKGFKCCIAQMFEKVNNISKINIELGFCQVEMHWRQKLDPIEISKKDSDRLSELLFNLKS